MTVYVDNARIPFGRMLMSHMIADTRQELDDMAFRLGVSHRWRQQSGTAGEHYDVCWSKRQKAVQCGAQELSTRELATICYDRRRAGKSARDRYFCEVEDGACRNGSRS